MLRADGGIISGIHSGIHCEALLTEGGKLPGRSLAHFAGFSEKQGDDDGMVIEIS